MDEHIINIVLGIIEGAIKKLESLESKLAERIEKIRQTEYRLDLTRKRAGRLLTALKGSLDVT